MRGRSWAAEFDHWHPGIASRIPREIRHLATIYRPENVCDRRGPGGRARRSHRSRLQASSWRFGPSGSLLHELLIRVTADISVPDGSKIEDLGINFRRIVNTILTRLHRAGTARDRGDVRIAAARPCDGHRDGARDPLSRASASCRAAAIAGEPAARAVPSGAPAARRTSRRRR